MATARLLLEVAADVDTAFSGRSALGAVFWMLALVLISYLGFSFGSIRDRPELRPEVGASAVGLPEGIVLARGGSFPGAEMLGPVLENGALSEGVLEGGTLGAGV